jgi:hypothetical protein
MAAVPSGPSLDSTPPLYANCYINVYAVSDGNELHTYQGNCIMADFMSMHEWLQGDSQLAK